MRQPEEPLDEENFVTYASQHYDNRQCCDVQEFYDDLSRFKYVKRLLRKYKQTGVIQERLVLNHLIIIYNVFGIKASNRMVFYKIEKEFWPTLKSFLIYLNYLPEHEKVEIPLDQNIVNILRKI